MIIGGVDLIREGNIVILNGQCEGRRFDNCPCKIKIVEDHIIDEFEAEDWDEEEGDSYTNFYVEVLDMSKAGKHPWYNNNWWIDEFELKINGEEMEVKPVQEKAFTDSEYEKIFV